jgi:hypothetical protein
VYRKEDRQWANKHIGSDRASSLHDMQREAAAAAKTMLENHGGGELRIKGLHGKIISEETISPGNSPCLLRDNEH